MAHREKDFEFVRALMLAGLIDPAILEERLASIDISVVESDQDVDVLEYRQRQSIIWLAGVLPPDPEQKQ